jgi:hypothetical protein
MSERYELAVPYQPLGAPSRSYRDGWDRVFGGARGVGKRKANESRGMKGGGGSRSPRAGAPKRVGHAPAGTPPTTPVGTSPGVSALA